MPIVINTNLQAINVNRRLFQTEADLSKTMGKLSSGKRIDRAGDDAAGVHISSRLSAQIRGSNAAIANVQDGINALNIADGAFQVIQDYVHRIRELVIQAATGTYSQTQRTAINQEIDQLRAEIDRVALSTRFNGVTLLSTSPSSLRLQIGANGTLNDSLSLTTFNLDGRAVGVNLGVSASGFIFNIANARSYLQWCNTAIMLIGQKRGFIGANIHRLEGAAQNLMIAAESNSAANARIRDVDIAAESGRLARLGVLRSAAVGVAAQATENSRLALQILTAEAS